MEEQKYLVAIALAEQNNKRIMPLGGKTFAGVDSVNQVPKNQAEKITLDLLLRLFKRTTEANLKISSDENGLLLADISFENMHTNLPIIKSKWINSGNTSILLKELSSICSNLCSIQYKKYEGMIFYDLMKK